MSRNIHQIGIGLERPRFQPRHIEQIADEAIEPLGLLPEWCAAMSCGPRHQVRRDARARLVAEPRIEASGVRRSCEIEVSSADRSRSVSSASRARSISAARLIALDRQRRLVGQRIEKPRAVRRQQAVRADRESMPMTPTAPRPVRIGRNSRLAPGNVSAPRPAALIVLHSPLRGGKVGLVQHVLRRIAGAHREPLSPSRQQDTTRTFSISAI